MESSRGDRPGQGQGLLVVLLHGAKSFICLYPHDPIGLRMVSSFCRQRNRSLNNLVQNQFRNLDPGTNQVKIQTQNSDSQRAPYLYTREKISGKTLTLIVRHPVYVFFSRIFLGRGEGFVENSKKETRSRIGGFGVCSGLLGQCPLELAARRPTEGVGEREREGRIPEPSRGNTPRFTIGRYTPCTLARVLLI